MAHKATETTVTPAVLEWVRNTSGYSHNDVARHLDVSPELVLSWEKESAPVTLRISQLENMANYYKRPLATLLLSAPPYEPEPPKDFRRAFQPLTSYSPELRLAIRRARRLQRIAREIMETMGLSIQSRIAEVNLEQAPEVVAKAQREALGIDNKEQLGWYDQWQAYRRWRGALESLNILVFQSDFSRDEAQGFSLSDSHPYVVMISAKDSPTARCFTLFHEFAHLLLREGGICITEIAHHQISGNLAMTEDWCHRFAEAFLIDDDIIRSSEETLAIIKCEPNYEQELKNLAFKFKVSQSVVLFRLWHCELISEGRFWAEYTKLQEAMQLARLKAQKKKTGWPSPAQRAVQERGRRLTRLVLDALDKQVIGYNEATDYLGIRVKHLDRVRERVYG